MTENQFREMMGKLTELNNEIQKMIEEQYKSKAGKVSLKTVVDELKDDQKTLEPVNRVSNNLTGESMKFKSRVEILEERIN